MANIDFNKFLSNAFSVGIAEKGISGEANLSISCANGKDFYLEGIIDADNWALYCKYMA